MSAGAGLAITVVKDTRQFWGDGAEATISPPGPVSGQVQLTTDGTPNAAGVTLSPASFSEGSSAAVMRTTTVNPLDWAIDKFISATWPWTQSSDSSK
jgi:hypothetical protein